MYRPKAKPEKKNKAISSSDKVALSPSTIHYEFMIDGDLTAIQANIYDKATEKRTASALIYAGKRFPGIEEKLKEGDFLEKLNKKIFEEVLKLASEKEGLSKLIFIEKKAKNQETVQVSSSQVEEEIQLSEVIERVRADIAESQKKISKKLKKLTSK